MFKYVTRRPDFFGGLRAWAEKSSFRFFLFEFILFGLKQGWAALFGGLLLGFILLSRFWYPGSDYLHRYDFLVLVAIAIQLGMLLFKLETWQEAKIILLFHVVGTVMELFKTYKGSWEYPEEGLLAIGGVPLFSGFMYAAVGSYLARVWRAFDFRFEGYPPIWITTVVGLVIYVNFFTHHFGPDLRYGLFAALLILFYRTRVYFRVDKTHYWMPLLLGFLLVAVFIWFAEQFATFANAWRYPNQRDVWQMVSFGKLGSWYLLMFISFVMVSWLHKIEGLHKTKQLQPADDNLSSRVDRKNMD